MHERDSDNHRLLSLPFDCLHFRYIDIAVVKYLEGGMSQKMDTLLRLESMLIQVHYNGVVSVFDSAHFATLLRDMPTENKNLFFSKMYNSFLLNLSILKEKQFVLYGYGTIGEYIYKNFSDNILCIVDKNADTISQTNPKVYSLDTLKEYLDDYILVSVLGREKEIEQYLIKQYGFKKEQIIHVKI